MYDGPDRRKRERFVTTGIDVFIQKTGWRSLFAKPERVESVDFNQYGIGFDTAQEFVSGDQMQLHIRIESAKLVSIMGIIRHVTFVQETGRYRVGVQLDILEIRSRDTEQLRTLLSRADIDLDRR
ncbi:MAG: hypothetical protein FD165_2201 [Gammaproteobacteria bacterium]|nr:MAG: hypothetical protein FD165_2201 [Gammaproteobacteria bacterium]TND03275.1 MAG: hypothetical protein FD120_1948 [Gammaproteobacteria bacterium]